MIYDKQNDRFISLDGKIKIYPHGETFKDAKTIEIGCGIYEINIDVNHIEDLIDGLKLTINKVKGK